MLLASSLSVQMGAALATTLFATVTPAGAAAGSFAVAAALLLGLRRPRLAAWPAARWRDTTLLGLTMATSAGIIFSVEPAIAVLVGVIALDERLTFEGGLGVAAVVLAGFLALRDSGEAPTNP
jgi:threonine/homoserine efflux transporter RhtA